MDPKLLLTIFLVFLNGFFVAAEFAIVKVRASQLELKAWDGDNNAKIAKHIVDHLDAYLSATQLWITLTSLWLWWVWEEAIGHIILTLFSNINIGITESVAQTIALPVSFFIITMLHIVFGELAPKSIAIRKPLATSLFIAWPLRVFYLVFKPLIWLFNTLSNITLRILGIKDPWHHEVHTEEELRLLLTESEEHGHIAEGSNELIQNVFEFDDRTIRHIYTPRSRVFMLDIEDDDTSNIKAVIDEWYSRIPVYEGSKDNIIGILYVKDLIKKIVHDEVFDIRGLLRPVFNVFLSQKIENVLKDIQTKHIQIAIVKNEHGETAGIVTLEDIIEELIGDIQDEHDDEKPLVIEKKPWLYIVRTEASISDINDVLPYEVPISDAYDTVAWLMLMLFGKIPLAYETIRFGQYEITILKRSDTTVEITRWKVVE